MIRLISDMKKVMILVSAGVCLLCCALLPMIIGRSSGVSDAALNFDVGLAELLIVVICSIIAAAILIFAVVMAVRNSKN